MFQVWQYFFLVLPNPPGLARRFRDAGGVQERPSSCMVPRGAKFARRSPSLLRPRQFVFSEGRWRFLPRSHMFNFCEGLFPGLFQTPPGWNNASGAPGVSRTSKFCDGSQTVQVFPQVSPNILRLPISCPELSSKSPRDAQVRSRLRGPISGNSGFLGCLKFFQECWGAYQGARFATFSSGSSRVFRNSHNRGLGNRGLGAPRVPGLFHASQICHLLQRSQVAKAFSRFWRAPGFFQGSSFSEAFHDVPGPPNFSQAFPGVPRHSPKFSMPFPGSSKDLRARRTPNGPRQACLATDAQARNWLEVPFQATRASYVASNCSRSPHGPIRVLDLPRFPVVLPGFSERPGVPNFSQAFPGVPRHSPKFSMLFPGSSKDLRARRTPNGPRQACLVSAFSGVLTVSRVLSRFCGS